MKSIFLYKVLLDYTALNLKELLIGSSLMHANYNLRNIGYHMSGEVISVLSLEGQL